MKELIIQSKGVIAATFFVVLSLFFWLEPNIFFFNDDWGFVDKYLHANRIQFIFTSYYGHIKPIFKSFFFAELFVFGKNTVFFQITALILFGLTAFIFSCVYREVSAKNAFAAIIIPVLWMSHPNCGDVTLWLFQVCIILHVLFQAMTILFYFKYRSSRNRLYFYLFIIALTLQNFSFGNGIFFPMLFIFAELLEVENGYRPTKTIMLLFAIQLIFILIQKLFSSEQVPFYHLIQNYGLILHAFYYLVSVSIVRFFVVKLIGGNVVIYFCLLLFLLLCISAYRNDRKKTLFCLFYLLVSSITIPIARSNISGSFKYYYSVLLLPSLFFLLYMAVIGLKGKLRTVAFVCSICILCCYFIGDIKMKKLYTYKDFKNKERLVDAILYSKDYYYPYDEPSVDCNLYMYLVDDNKHPELQRSIQKNSYFGMDSSVADYYGESGVTYKNRAKRTINCYKELSKKTVIDFDVAFEKK